MLNWCFSSVVITGSPEELKRLADIIDPDFDFNRIIPMPEELRTTVGGSHIEYMVYYGDGFGGRDHEEHRAELDQEPKNRERANRDRALLDKYGAYDWYDWCVKNWGNKWPAQEVEIETHDGEISIFFETAWSFPEPIFDRLGAMFPSLDFEGHAEESLMGWVLDFEVKDGLADFRYSDLIVEDDDDDGDITEDDASTETRVSDIG